MIKFFFSAEQFFLKIFRTFVSSLSGGNECAVCSSFSAVLPVCPSCRKKYFKVQRIGKTCSERFCEVCGKALVSESERCLGCRSESVLSNLDRAFPLFPYRLWNTNLLCRWKLKGERVLSGFFAGLVKIRLDEIFQMFGDVFVVPVPPRPGKIKKSGWDQIEELSRFLEMRHGVKIHRILGRRNSAEQKTLDREERLLTMGSAYFLKENAPCLPETVCILDDVMTTGATLEGIARILKENGAKKVLAVTLFTVDS